MTTEVQGLSSQDVLERRKRGLGNQAPVKTSRSYGMILRENVFNPVNNVIYILGIALVIMGQPGDAVVAVMVILINVVISAVQEVRAKRTLDRIALLTRPKISVIRDGREQTVDPGEIVVGDFLLARPGDQIVVDGRVSAGGRTEMDESLLTGESDPVQKNVGDEVHSGSFCLTGSMIYQAEKVGLESMAQKVTASARAFRRMLTPLQREVTLVLRVLLLIVLYFEVILAINTVTKDIPLVESVRMSVVITSLAPSGMLLAIALAYALGAVRIAGKGALVQQSNAIESLSNVDVLCLDKTGTLTANRFLFHSVSPLGISEVELQRWLGDFAQNTSAGNRTTDAIAAALPGQKRNVRSEVPFSSERKWSALVFDDADIKGSFVLGAPEMLQPALNTPLNLEDVIKGWTEKGLRVLLLARSFRMLEDSQDSGSPKLPEDLSPLGFVVLSDELRPEAQRTLVEFSQAGVQLKIISGDNAQTVASLAMQAGFSPDVRMISGPDLSNLDPTKLEAVAEETTIFGRITPQQKEAIIQGLRQRGHYVAMIGDGVNDVLSLKRANLAIAMQGGSQAARSVADMVLLNDSFAVLPSAVREGQRIVVGMQNILKLFLSRVFYIVILVLSTSLIGGFPLVPKQNSLLAFFTTGITTAALALWAKPELRPRGSLLRRLLHFVIPAGLTLSVMALVLFLFYTLAFERSLVVNNLPTNLTGTWHLAVAQTVLTHFLMLTGLLLVIFVVPPTPFWAVAEKLSEDWRPTLLSIFLIVLYGLFLLITPLREFFDLVELRLADYAFIAGAAVYWVLLARAAWRWKLVDKFLKVE